MKKSVGIFLIVSAVLLLATTTGLTVALVSASNQKAESEQRLNAVYERSYFDAIDCLNDVKQKLDKLTVLSTPSLQSSLLADVWRESELSATSLSQLGTENDELDKILKFLNQLSDYARYLSDKTRSAALSVEEKDNLGQYKTFVSDLSDDLAKIQEKLVDGERIDLSGLSDYSVLSDVVKTYSTVEYPEMIYDGPFSDGLNDRETKFLKGKEEIDESSARDKIPELFPDATGVEYVGESNASVPAYLYSFRLGRNQGTLALTKVGGYVLSYNAYCEITDPTLSEEECVQKGNEYIKSLGYDDMKAVWVNNNDSTVYINYAYQKDDVVVYPDLIKLKICSQTGDLIGLEAQNYLYNHVARSYSFDKTATLVINDDLEIVSQTYCVIPTESNEEIAAKEIVATRDGTTYYLYYDLTTKQEVRCLVVVEADGKLLQ